MSEATIGAAAAQGCCTAWPTAESARRTKRRRGQKGDDTGPRCGSRSHQDITRRRWSVRRRGGRRCGRRCGLVRERRARRAASAPRAPAPRPRPAPGAAQSPRSGSCHVCRCSASAATMCPGSRSGLESRPDRAHVERRRRELVERDVDLAIEALDQPAFGLPVAAEVVLVELVDDGVDLGRDAGQRVAPDGQQRAAAGARDAPDLVEESLVAEPVERLAGGDRIGRTRRARRSPRPARAGTRRAGAASRSPAAPGWGPAPARGRSARPAPRPPARSRCRRRSPARGARRSRPARRTARVDSSGGSARRRRPRRRRNP